MAKEPEPFEGIELETGEELSFNVPAGKAVVIMGNEGKVLAEIEYDGTVTLGHGVEPNEAAKAFYQAISGYIHMAHFEKDELAYLKATMKFAAQSRGKAFSTKERKLSDKIMGLIERTR